MDFEFVDFDIVKENWSQYKLRDGTIVRIRFILLKTRKYKGRNRYGKPRYDINSKNVVGMIPNKSLLGKPSGPIPAEVLGQSIVDEDIQFETIKEPWNEYRLKDGTIIRVKLVLTIVSRTDKFDESGEPIYLLNMQPIMKGVPYAR